MIQEQFNNRSRISKSNMHVQRLREGAAKHHRKKGNASERKRKKHSKSTNNMKTDNRKMTGNVNIYICSEAAENTQVILLFLALLYLKDLPINRFIR